MSRNRRYVTGEATTKAVLRERASGRDGQSAYLEVNRVAQARAQRMVKGDRRHNGGQPRQS